jgi:hypothetical protein
MGTGSTAKDGGGPIERPATARSATPGAGGGASCGSEAGDELGGGNRRVLSLLNDEGWAAPRARRTARCRCDRPHPLSASATPARAQRCREMKRVDDVDDP